MADTKSTFENELEKVGYGKKNIYADFYFHQIQMWNSGNDDQVKIFWNFLLGFVNFEMHPF